MNKKPYNACKKCGYHSVVTQSCQGEYTIRCARNCGSATTRSKNLEMARKLWNKENE